MRISDWRSDVCSSDLALGGRVGALQRAVPFAPRQSRQVHRKQFERTLQGGLGQQLLFALRIVGAIGRASCRESVCHYVYISGVAVSLNKNILHIFTFRFFYLLIIYLNSLNYII